MRNWRLVVLSMVSCASLLACGGDDVTPTVTDGGSDAGTADSGAADTGVADAGSMGDAGCTSASECSGGGGCLMAACVDGECTTAPVADDTTCDDEDVCTSSDVCRSGVCAGAAVDCSDMDTECVVGVCDATSGACGTTPTNEGNTCDDGDATTAAQCDSGACVVMGCEVGLADCNTDLVSDGCESDLSTAQHCGDCTSTCEVACMDDECDLPVHIALTATSGQYCVVLESGRVACGLPAGLSLSFSSTYTDVSDMDSYVHRCWIGTGGLASCSGSNGNGQLGNDSTTSSSSPVTPVGLGAVSDVSVNIIHSCAVRTDGTVWCWGGNPFGQLGQGDTMELHVPTQVPGLTNIEKVVAGNTNTCALESTGGVQCWGLRGRSGRNNAGTGSPGAAVGITTATHLEYGMGHGCAILMDDTVQCWGLNNSGQAAGSASEHLVPHTVTLPGAASDIALGDAHSCAIVSGSLYCWGDNSVGALGVAGASSDAPVLVAGLTNVTRVFAKGSNTCAIVDEEEIYCWGRFMSATPSRIAAVGM